MTVVDVRAKVVAIGRPCYVTEDRPGHIAYVHANDDAAERSAEVNREQHGHRSWVEWREGVAVTVVDLRPAGAA